MSENYPYTNKNQILRINRPYFCPYFQFLPNAILPNVILPNVIMNISLPELWVSAMAILLNAHSNPKNTGNQYLRKWKK